MAEFVEYRKEQMMSELEQMRKLMIFSEEEIRKIHSKRDQYHYSISKSVKSIHEFADFIKYEKKLLEVVKERIKIRKISSYPSHLISSLVKQVKKMYSTALKKFPNNMRVWDAYIAFCMANNSRSEVSVIHSEITRLLPTKGENWQRYIMWEYEETRNLAKVKNLFMQAVQKNPTYIPLYLMYIKIELQEGEQAREREEEQDVDLAIKRAIKVYNSGKDKITSLEYYSEVLNVVQVFRFAGELEDLITNDMVTQFSENEDMWNMLASRERLGYHRSLQPKAPAEEGTEAKCSKESEEKEPVPVKIVDRPLVTDLVLQIKNCERAFEEGIQHANTPKMWNYYICEMIKLNYDLAEKPAAKRSALGRAFRNAFDAVPLSVEHYLIYIDLIDGSEFEEFKLTVLKKAVYEHEESEELWEKLLKFYIVKRDEEELLDAFDDAKTSLKTEEAYLIWKLMIDYYKERPKKAEAIINEAVFSHPHIADQFKPFYINWMSRRRDIDHIRSVYKKLSTTTLPCLMLHDEMIKVELAQDPICPTELRKCHENKTQFFGVNNTFAWIDYIKFELEHGEPKNISAISTRVTQVLTAELMENYQIQYDFLRSQFSSKDF